MWILFSSINNRNEKKRGIANIPLLVLIHAWWLNLSTERKSNLLIVTCLEVKETEFKPLQFMLLISRPIVLNWGQLFQRTVNNA